MIIWKGYGFLVVVIAFGFLLATNFLTNAIYHDPKYYETHWWPALVALLAAAPLVWFLGRYLNKQGSRTLVDPETDEVFTFKNDHSLFFIPMEYWGPLLIVLGIATCFIDRP